VYRRLRSPSGRDVFPRGLPTPGAKPIEQVPLVEALTRRWDDDRHIVLYTSDRPYRINNAAVAEARVEVRLLAFDVDNHDDAPGWMEAERPKIAALLAAHPGGFAYTTRRGWRVFYALPAPFRVASEADKRAFVLLYARVAAYVFARFGIALDAALIRWNQPVRLPHVVRDGKVLDAEILAGDAHALGVFELPEDVPSKPDLRALAQVVPSWGSIAKQWQPEREKLRIATSEWDHVPLPPYPERLAAAAAWAREQAPRAIQGQGGRVTARSVAAMLHVGFALQREDVEALLTGAYNSRRCAPPWSDAQMDELRTIAQGVAKTPVHVPGFMLSRDRTGIEAARATLADEAAARHAAALGDVPTRVVDAIEQHRAVIVRATYGAGKTHAMSQYIATCTTGRVLVVVPRHELGRAWVEQLAAAGEMDVAYHASVVQRRDEQGRRHCDNKHALPLYERGGDVRRDVCPSCPRRTECPAYAEHPRAGARVHVLPREMIPKFGVTDDDLVVFDDAAVDLLAWHRLTVRQLQRLSGADVRLLPAAQRRYVGALVDALLAGPRAADEIARAALGDVAGEAASTPGAALRLLAGRAVDGQRSPHLPSDLLAEGGDELAATLRDAGTLREVLRFAAACADGAEVHWSDGVRSVHGETAAAKLLRAHGGRLVVLDAAANLDELGALRGDWHVERLDVPDAGDTKRTLLFVPNAHRTALRDASKRRALLDEWLGAALALLTERGVRRAVLVSYQALVPELRQHPAVLAWLAERPRRKLRFAHYGALRGSNRFQGTQAVVTLGDPWLNGQDVAGRAEWLDLPDEPTYRIELARAELGQAHGRSRSVRRRRRLTHVHVGRLVPEGWGAGVEVEPLGGPPERSRGEAAREEFEALVGAVGGNRAAAAAIGCSRSAVSDWRRGRRPLPRHALERLRALHADTPNASASSGEAGGARARGMDAGLCKQERTRARVHLPAMPVEGVGGDLESEETVLAGPADRLSLAPQNSPSLSPTSAVVIERAGSALSSDPPREDRSLPSASATAVGEPSAGEQQSAAPPAVGGEAGAQAAPRLRSGLYVVPPAGAVKPEESSGAGASREPSAPAEGRYVPASRQDVAAFVARALAALDAPATGGVAPGAVAAVARGSPETPRADDPWRAELLAAQERARRKLGLGPSPPSSTACDDRARRAGS